MPELRRFTQTAKDLEFPFANLYSTLAYVKPVPIVAPATQELRGIRKEATALNRDRMFGRTRRITACMAAVGVAGALAAASANATIVYDNASSPLPGNLPSQAFDATQTAELGGEVGLAGSDRLAQWVQVEMSSWGCENGTWNGGNCSTTPGTTFNEPITLNLYQVGAGGAQQRVDAGEATVAVGAAVLPVNVGTLDRGSAPWATGRRTARAVRQRDVQRVVAAALR